MDVQATKIELIHWLSQLEDPTILEQLMLIKGSKDWWDEISEEERLSIDQGIAELDRGEGIPHEKVLQTIKEKFNL